MVNLLYANDRRGVYPDSWYAATTDLPAQHPALKGTYKADVCVIGAGYTGLSAALHLAKDGLDVVLLDAQRIGFGASGRNGGQLGSGQRQDQRTLEAWFGRADAQKLWALGEDAKALVKSLINTHGIDCFLRPGVADAASRQDEVDDLHAYAEFMEAQYNYPLEVLDKEAFAALCPSPDYRGGVLDPDAAHLHPLRYALGLGRAAQAAGVRVFERSDVHNIDRGTPHCVRTGQGQVHAEHVVLATNGYNQSLSRKVAARVMPINNFIAATEPLGDDAARVLTKDIAVADSRFVVNYFRLSHDKRLLFGGGESYGYKFPRDIAGVVRKPMTQIFPHLKDVKIDYAWGGTLAITMKRLPMMTQVAPNILSASGYSGHGVGTATHAGYLMAKTISAGNSGFETLARLPAVAFPGGAALRAPLLASAMTWYALRDRLGF